MQHVEVSRRFEAPVEKVWNVYTDHARWKEWAGFASSWLEREGDTERDGRGAVRGFGNGPVKVWEEVLEFEPPRRMTYRVVRGGLPMRDHLGEVEFERDDGSTLLVWRCRFDARWPVPGLAVLMRLVVERVFRDALEGLARRGFDDTPA